MTAITRRTALQTAMLGGAAACSSAPELTPFDALPSQTAPYFRHGVASGDPGPDSVVIWTRFFNEALSSDLRARRVKWEVASDRDFTAVVASGESPTGADRDWTVKALADGLDPGRSYFYRFSLGTERSPVGRTRTLPKGSLAEARFAILSCTNYPFGHFNVYDQVARRDGLDAVIHLGDYIYEYGQDGYGGESGARLGRPHDPPHELITLADYRRRHAQYKSDPASQTMHAAHPVIALWDDHETADNSWAGGANNHDPKTEGDWAERKRAALQAYYEWMPVREPEPGRTREALFRAYSFGDLLTLATLETRLMARSQQINLNDVRAGLKTPEDAARFRETVLMDETRELLGSEQLDFFDRTLRQSSDQPWRLIANQVIIAEVIAPDLSPHVDEAGIEELQKLWTQARAFVETSRLGLPTNLDAWDGYPAARERFYETLRRAGGGGVIVLTGDTHTWWANDLRARDGAHVGVELGAHSVTSPSPYRKEFLAGKGAEYALLTNKGNKAVRYISGEHHGYIDLYVRRDRVDARFMAIDSVETPDYNSFEKAAFTITQKDGRAQFSDADGLSFREGWLF